MQKFTNVRSTAETVQELEINESSVIVNSGIKEIHEQGTEGAPSSGFDGWEIAEQIIYDKDEYIKVISEKNASLEQETTNLQLALTEVYEQVLAQQ
jgi:hypothetical protein